MAIVQFYEKPGCINNTRQKAWLAASGHQVVAHNLLTTPWSAAELRAFFGELPVTNWFNMSAPRITAGEVDPAVLDADTALAMMVEDPLLIRRPLLEAAGVRRVGFDPAAVDNWIGLVADDNDADPEKCPRKDDHRCP